MLQRVLLPLVFNCWQTALCNIPVDDGEHPVFKIQKDDFAVPDQGMDFETIDGFICRVARPLKVKLGFSEILFIMNFFPDFFDQEILDDTFLKNLNLSPIDEKKSNEAIKISIPFFRVENKRADWCFDSFLLPPKEEKNPNSIVVGLSVNPLLTSVFAMNKSAKRGDNPWYILYSVGSDGKGKIDVWSKSSAWAEQVLRRSVFQTCINT